MTRIVKSVPLTGLAMSSDPAEAGRQLSRSVPRTGNLLTSASWSPAGAIPPRHARRSARRQRVTCSVRREGWSPR